MSYLAPNCVASLKYGAESKTRYHVICAGSLLGVKIKRSKSSFPVGKVKMLHMHPMGFEGYLDAAAIYRSVPYRLGNSSHKFQYAKVKKGARGRDIRHHA